MFCVAHDVTDRAQMEKALRAAKDEADRANLAKSEFLSRMSHELRTPLNAIIGFGQLLERQEATPTQRNRINHILGAGRHLLSLINEVLDISRLDTGNLPLSLEPVCVADAADEAMSLMRPLAAERRIELSLPEPLDRHHYVMADGQRLKQVLLNLLTNAVKYTPINGRVTVSANPTGHGTTRIVVNDTGEGIASEKLARLFTPFERLGAEQTDVEGTGLGLALCQRLMQAMNGSIGADSASAQGSSFWVELHNTESPLQRAGLVYKPPQSSRKAEVPSLVILYIEDNLSNFNLIEQVLAEMPHIKLMSAMQGELGIELARRHAPDLILLDLHLPDIPGWEVLSRLQQDDSTRDLPVIIISADATTRQIDRLLKAGARSYLTKPLDIPEFLKAINDATASPAEEASVAA
jgi:CheY-like chemotaxis protein